MELLSARAVRDKALVHRRASRKGLCRVLEDRHRLHPSFRDEDCEAAGAGERKTGVKDSFAEKRCPAAAAEPAGQRVALRLTQVLEAPDAREDEHFMLP